MFWDILSGYTFCNWIDELDHPSRCILFEELCVRSKHEASCGEINRGLYERCCDVAGRDDALNGRNSALEISILTSCGGYV